MMLQSPIPCHVIILTALPVEFRAVAAHLERMQEIVHPETGTTYQIGSFSGHRGLLRVAVAQIGMGGVCTAAETERAISFWRPQLALFVGIAGGLKDVRLGDVVASSKIYAYESGKAGPLLDTPQYSDEQFPQRESQSRIKTVKLLPLNAREYEPRPELWRPSYVLEQRVRTEVNSDAWLLRLNGTQPDPAPKVFLGALASGEKVVASTQSSVYRLLKATYGDALAVEMEGHGFLQVLHANPHIHGLVIRGISDLIDEKSATDAAGWQNVAARHAAAFAFQVAAKFALPPVPETSQMQFSLLDRRARQCLLKQVQSTWIEGVLESSLHQAAMLQLNFQEQPDALTNPWHMEVQETNRPPRPLPLGISVVDIYDKADGKLLILGEPGAGKTTLLLELARTLLKRAEQNEQEGIPVVFHLSSWAAKRQPLSIWLVEELKTKYQIPRQIGSDWINENQILPLFDGLDEIDASSRPACIQAINEYHLEHRFTSLVVCSRKNEYLSQAQRLSLSRAVSIQPLTTEQITAYFARIGTQALGEVLHQDADLRELATIPLMLTTMVFACQETSLDKISELTSLEAKREQIFATYVQHTLKRRGVSKRYQLEQTIHWLNYLARQMKQQRQTVFSIEHMQPNWLPEGRLPRFDQLHMVFGMLIGGLVSLLFTSIIFRKPFTMLTGVYMLSLAGLFIARNHAPASPREETEDGKQRNTWSHLRKICRRLAKYGMVMGLAGVMNAVLNGGVQFRLSHGIGDGLIYGLAGILLSVSLARSKRMSQFLLRWSKRLSQPFLASEGGFIHRLLTHEHAYNGLLVGLICWLGWSLHAAVKPLFSFGLLLGWDEGLRYGLVFGLAGALTSILIKSKKGEIRPTEIVVWSWRDLGRRLFEPGHLKSGVLIAITVGLVTVLSYGAIRNAWLTAVGYGSSVALLIFFDYWLLVSLAREISSDRLQEEHRIRPNQGIKCSAHNSFRAAILSGLIGCISATIDICILIIITKYILHLHHYDINNVPICILLFGLACGLLGGLLHGGLACLQHFVLRWLLWCNRSIPWNYPHFLDYAAERVLLRKVGGSYIFFHDLLLRYFATLSPPPSVAQPRTHGSRSDTNNLLS
jgi:nucleoside phosphorylase/DNA polymerase III delta prime subunit